MDSSVAIAVLLAVIASGGLWTFVQFMITRKDKKTEYVTKEDLKKAPATCQIHEEVTAVKTEIEDIKKDITNLDNGVETIKAGTQALLRSQIIHVYNKYIDKGYAPIYEKENMENMYKKYHELGANGVMTGLYTAFMELPTEKPTKTK